MRKYAQLAGKAVMELAFAGMIVLTISSAVAGTAKNGQVASNETEASALASEDRKAQDPIQIQSIEPADSSGLFSQEKTTWLGVGVEEAPEVLTAQLGLDPGAGLVVTYVETNSPAAVAGLAKNDVLAEFDGQTLVIPAQLRKLVRVHKNGDTVKLVYFRTGKKQTVSATLAMTVAGFGSAHDGDSGFNWNGLSGIPKSLDTLSNLHIDQAKLQQQIQRSMELARKDYQQAMERVGNARQTLGSLAQNFDTKGMSINDDATVTIRSTENSAKSLVKADDSGTIVLVKNPKLHLTAHDKDGKLLFDGEIETDEQRAEVPRDLWKKVEPLVKKISAPGDEPSDPN